MITPQAFLAIATGASSGPWAVLLGRLHVLAVHFPIALLWMAAIAELVRIARKREERSATAFACLSLGALSALVAAGLGWLHAEAEPLGRSVADTLFLHRWVGVATATAALLAWLFAALRHRRAYRLTLVASVVLASAAGHLGAALVYGTDYLTDPLRAIFAPARSAPAEPESASDRTADASQPSAQPAADVSQPSAQPAGGAAQPSKQPGGGVQTDSADPKGLPPSPGDAQRPVDFATQVQPLLAEHCTGCHGPKRQRGDLRLDDLPAHFARPREEWVIRPGDADASELVRRITLPADDEDVMPASGDPLTPEQIALLRAWIEQGAHHP